MARGRRSSKDVTKEKEVIEEAEVSQPEKKQRKVSQRQKRKSEVSIAETEDTPKQESTPNKRRKSELKEENANDTSKEQGTGGGVANGGAAARGTKYWLMKAEPESRIVKGKDVKFSIDDLEEMKTSPWDGVRNHQAKNFMKDMKLGDKSFLYHSNCKIPGIAGVMEVCKEAYPDHTATDPSHPYYDEKSTKKDEPTWFMVDVRFMRRLKRLIPLKELQEYKEAELKDMVVVGKTRLSVQPVRQKDWEFILTLEDKVPEEG